MIRSIKTKINIISYGSIVFLMLLGVLNLATDIIVNSENTDLRKLYQQNEITQRLMFTIMQSNVQMVDVIFNNKEEVASSALALNEEIAGIFEEFIYIAEENNFIEDISFALENESLITEIRTNSLKIVDLYRKGKVDEAKKVYRSVVSNYSNKIVMFAEDSSYQRKITIDKKNRTIQNFNTIIFIITSVFVVIIVLANIISSAVVKSSIIKPLKTITGTAGEIAEGNLNVKKIRIKNKDELGFLTKVFNEMIDNLNRLSVIAFNIAEGRIESQALPIGQDGTPTGVETLKGDIGRAFFKMVRNLKDIVVRVKELTINLNSSTQEIEAAAQQQTSGANEQASGSTEVSATLEQLKITANQISKNVGELVFSSEEVSGFLQKSKEQLMRTCDHLDEVGRMSKANTTQVMELGNRSAVINEMVEMIKEIANKTNILSINASIEASRSGESGAGFSVVASEIRELSKETIMSTKSVEKAALDIRNYITSIVSSSEDESQRVIESGKVLKGIYDDIENIVEKNNRNFEFTQKIEVSIKQQESGSKQAAETMKQMSDVARQSAESARQTLLVVKDIVGMARELNESLKNFTV